MATEIPNHADIQTLNACFELEYLLLGELRELLDELDTEHSRASILLILDRLLVNFPRQLKLKAEGKYLSKILESYPEKGDAESLRFDDQGRVVVLQQLREAVAAGAPCSEIASEIQRELYGWMKALADDRTGERRMIGKANRFEADSGS